MEFRILLFVLNLLDPRRWRLRLAQLAGAVLGIGWIWTRSVNRAEVLAAKRDVRRAERTARIRARIAEREAEHWRV